MIISDAIALCGITFTLVGSITFLILGRFAVGIVVGITCTSVPLYINEITPSEIRGQMGSHFQTAINIGILMTFLIGLGIPTEEALANSAESNNYWRIMFAISYLPVLLRLFLFSFIFTYDTPQFHYTKHQQSQMLEVLHKIYEIKQVQEQQQIIEQKAIDNQDGELKDLFSNKYKNRLIVGLILSALTQLSGINSVVFYSSNIFNSANASAQTTQIFCIIVAICLIIGPFMSGFIIDRAGRKTILLVGEIIMIFCLISLVIASNMYFAAFFICIYCFGFGVSFGPIFWILIPELLPDIGVSCASVVNWFFTALIGQFFPFFKNEFTLSGVFIIFSAFLMCGVFFTSVFVHETKGKSSSQIILDYGDKMHAKSKFNYINNNDEEQRMI